MDAVTVFDIFSGIPDREAIWVCAVEGLSNAKERMVQIAFEKTGPYFIFNVSTQQVIATTQTFAKPERATPCHPQLQAALLTLRKAGRTIGEVSEVDKETRVVVDGQSRTRDEVFDMIEDYNNRKRA